MSARSTTAVLVLVLVLVGLASATRGRAQSVKDRLEVTRQAVETQRRVLVAGALPLTADEAKAFWPIYDDYERERRGLDERANRLVAAFVASLPDLSDARAKTMLAEAFAVDDERLGLRRRYSERMAKALPPRKLIRFYQIDNKLDSVVRADVAKQIPLAP